jgi:hypothetical protein
MGYNTKKILKTVSLSEEGVNSGFALINDRSFEKEG